MKGRTASEMILRLKLCEMLVMGRNKLLSVKLRDLLLHLGYHRMNLIFNTFAIFLWILIKQRIELCPVVGASIKVCRAALRLDLVGPEPLLGQQAIHH